MLNSSACLRLHPLMPINCGKPQASRVTAQFIMRASLAESIELDFVINKQWKLSLILMTYMMPYH